MATHYIVHHEYAGEKDDELSLSVGDILICSDRSDPGWWVGEKLIDGKPDGKAGWFPSNFVDPVIESAAPSAPVPAAPASVASAVPDSGSEETAAQSEADSTAIHAPTDSLPSPPKKEGPVLARIEYDYEAKESGELSLEAGRVVTIIDSSDAAWWKGDLNGRIGVFPSNYVKIIESKDEGEDASEKPVKFKLAAFGVKQGGLGSLFAGGVVPGLKKTGGLKKLAGVDSPQVSVGPGSGAVAGVGAASGSLSKRTSMDEPRSPAISTPPAKTIPPVVEEIVAPSVQSVAPAHVTPPAPIDVPVPTAEEVTVPAPLSASSPSEPRVPSRAKKVKAKQVKAIVVYDYAAQEDDEITLVKGSIVVVTDKLDNEGWWSGRNEQGESGNFPSDFVEEINDDTPSTPTLSPPVPVLAAVGAVVVPHDEPPQSPVHSRPPMHAPVALPPIPVEPIHAEAPTTPTRAAPPTATPPPAPRTSRPPSVVSSPTASSAQLHDAPPLPSSPPPRRQSMVSRSSSYDYPTSPRSGTVPVFPTEPLSPTSSVSGELSRSSSTLRRHHRPIPEAPVAEAEEGIQEHTSETADSTLSRRSSYILPTPVARNRPLPSLARPPSIHQVSECRKSVVLPHSGPLPPVPSEPEAKVVNTRDDLVVVEEEDATEVQDDEGVEAEKVAEVRHRQDNEELAPVTTSPETLHSETEQLIPVAVKHEEPVTVSKLETEVHPGDHEIEVTHAAEPKDIVEHEAHKDSAEDAQEAKVDIKDEVEPEHEGELEAKPEPEPEAEPEKKKLPEVGSTGPTLSHASRPRPAKGRKLPSAPVPNPEASFVSQLEAEVKAAPIVEEKKPEPTPVATSAPAPEKSGPPPKPIKPIFQKFPTPFAGASPASVALRPTGRRVGQEGPLSPGSSGSSESGSVPHPSAITTSSSGGSGPPVGGVKSLGSRFGQFQGVPQGGGNSAVLELEIAKLRRWMTEELDRVKRELSDERDAREKLEAEVARLRGQLQG